jgi:hypothetical protein
MNSVEDLDMQIGSSTGTQDLLRNEDIPERRNVQLGRPNAKGRRCQRLILTF